MGEKGRTMESRFSSKCGHCQKRINAGDTIVDSGKTRTGKKRTVSVWVCPECFDSHYKNEKESEEKTMLSVIDFERLGAAEQRAELADIRNRKKVSVTASELRTLDAEKRVLAYKFYVQYYDGLITIDELETHWLTLCCPDSEETETKSVKEEKKPVKAASDNMEMFKQFQTFMEMFAPKADVDMEQVKDIIKQEIAKTTKRVTVERYDGTVKDVGVQHYIFDKVLKLVAIRENILLVGPAGSGKTTICMNVAKALDLDFSFTAISSQTTSSKIFGYMDAHGDYVTTEFYKRYTEGGVFLLDEVDAGNPNILTEVNAALENGHAAFPCGMVKRHENFVCIAAGNTFGRGADRVYVGRNPLDGATLDRFINIEMDYDETLERAIAVQFAPSDKIDMANKWIEYVQKLRKAAFDLKERIIISPRASIRGVKMLTVDFTTQECLDMLVWKGVPQEIRDKITAKAA